MSCLVSLSVHPPAGWWPRRLTARQWLSLAVVLLLAVTVLESWRPAPAQAAAPVATPQAPAEAKELTRPDPVSARITARAAGRKVEVLNHRTDTTQVFAYPNGTLSMTSRARPVRVKRKDGSWAPIDTTLAVSAEGIKPAATTVDLTFSPGGTGPLVTVAHAGTTLAVTAPASLGPLPAPTLAGDTATYPDVLPGVDLKVVADGQGFSQVLVVKTKEAAANPALTELAFPTAVKGGDLKADEHGNLRVFGSKDTKEPLLVGPAPRMWDSSAAQPPAGSKTRFPGSAKGPGTAKTHKAIPTTVAGGTVKVKPDQALLNDTAAVYPVFIDPGVTVNRFLWSLVDSGNPDTAYYNTTLDAAVGTWNSGANKYRSFFGMATKPLTGTHILSADFVIHELGAWDCTARPVQFWATSAIYNTSTWNSQPTWSGSPISTQTVNHGGDTACPAADVTFPTTALIQQAADNGWSGTSVGIRVPAANEVTNDYYKFFDNNPVLNVTYNTVPTVPAGTTISPCYTACYPADPRIVGGTTPKFRSIAKDGDGGQRVRVQYEIRQGTTSIQTGYSDYGVNNGWVSWTPATALTHGQTYTVRVRGHDGVDYSPWSGDLAFTVDAVAPVAASVSSTDYPAGAWSKRADQSGDFTLGTNSDFAGFVYGLDQNPPTTEVQASSGAKTISLTPDVDGPHTLYVRSRDKAGNLGPLTTYAFNVGEGAITTPKKGDTITGLTSVQAIAPSTVTGYTLQWRRADADTWVNVPAADVTLAAGGGAVTWPQSRTSGTFPKLTWDVAQTVNAAEAGADPLAGPVQARILLTGGPAGDSAPLKLSFDPSAGDAEGADVGPGEVNLVTGNLAVSDGDVSIDSYGTDLTLARTYNTRKYAVSDVTGMFGPGWTSSVVVDAAGSYYTSLAVTGSLVQVGTADGETIGFTAKSGGGFIPELGAEGLTLTSSGSPVTSYTVSDLDGNTTVFSKPGTSTQWKPTAINVPGSSQTTSLTWETVTVASATVTRPTRMLAPVPAGVTCGAGTSGLVEGCRALSFTYATTTTATGSTLGDYTGRVKEVLFTGWDPDLTTPAMRSIAVARYAYDASGRLRQAWDPQLDHDGGQHLTTAYNYDSDGVLTEITPVAEQPWQLSYTTVPGDSGKGRLKQVTRSALSAGTARTTVVYRVPVTGSSAPYDMAATQTARWGQDEQPTQATAVFPPTQVPDGDQPAGTLPSSYERADIIYLDTAGRAVNTVEPGGYTNTTWFDAWDNEIRTLTAGNRQHALDASGSDSSADEAALAAKLSTVHTYEHSGRRLKETLGPEHETAIPDGSAGWRLARARAHTINTYDEGAPSGGPYDLVTTQVTGANLEDGTTADTRTTTTTYNWDLRQPTATTIDPSGLNLTTRTSYDAVTGLPLTTTAPAGGTSTNTPRTQHTVYYSVDTNTTHPECGSKPEWANLPCRVQAGGNPSAGQPIPVSTTTYDLFNQPRVVTEKTPSGTTLRTTTTTYDAAARPSTVQVTGGSGTGQPVPTTKTTYETATGRLSRTQSLDASGNVTAEILRTYDGLGRLATYTDADGNESTTTYDLLSRTATTNDGKATQTYAYDTGSYERRGLLTRIVDSQAGTFDAEYDADGQLTQQTLPNGLVQVTGYDETGSATYLQHAEPGCTTATNCVDIDEWAVESIHGQQATHGSDFSGQNYSYDKVGRLTTVQDTVEPVSGWAGCATRTYGFDSASNRTSHTIYGPADGGGCQTSTAATSRSWSYDTADRVTSSGYTYDTLGRTTTVPTADTGENVADTTVAYHVTDMVRSISHNGRTATYTLDVSQDRVRTVADSWAGTKTHHYDADSDAPAWTDEGGDRYTRAIASFAGLVAIYDSADSAPKFKLTNLHGDVIADVSADQATDPGILANYETTEYGLPRDSADTGWVRYGYLGTHQRAADSPSGLTVMGVRLYSPATGRFLSADPVSGGSCNDYEYTCGDPVNKNDLNGEWVTIAIRGCLRFCKYVARPAVNHVVRSYKWAGGQIFRGGKAAWSGVKSAYNKVKKNNYVRAGKSGQYNHRRVSTGPAKKHWNKLSPRKQKILRWHIHVDRRYGGIDNWAKGTNRTWWRRY